MNTSWPTLTEAVFACEKCRLCQTRTNVVLGEGDLHAPLMFIGEGPGQQEDLSGRPFVGAAGQLLDKMLAAIGLKREQVYICNIVKCRPPQNRVPEPDERAGLQRAVHGTGSAGFGLHLSDADRLTKKILAIVRSPVVRDFRHRGRRGDRVDRCHFAERISDVADSGIAVNGHFLSHW